jgi:hypothetical protein|tara:strand:- start:341 stop:787 length:447 start_codon:yes stop_codon:yes gene_type:complete
MNRISEWTGLIGNIGMLVGLFFLVYEIQVNTNSVRASTYASWNEAAQSWGDYLGENSADLSVAMRADSFEALSEQHRWVVMGLATKSFNQGQAAFLHHKAGVITDEVFNSYVSGLIVYMQRNPILLSVWEQDRNAYAASFVKYIEDQL